VNIKQREEIQTWKEKKKEKEEEKKFDNIQIGRNQRESKYNGKERKE
jgi:hypothetical protein